MLVTPKAIRHYVRVGLLFPSRDPENGYRLFSDSDLQRMDDALEKWKTMPDGEPDGDEICHLIESVA